MKSKQNSFLYFLKTRPKDTASVIILLFLAGLTEAIGIAAFLPFLQLFIDGKDQIESIPIDWLDQLIKNSGIILNFETVSLFIVATLSLKAIVLWFAMRCVSHIVSNVAEDFRNSYMRAVLKSKWSRLVSLSLGESLNSISTETFRASQTFLSSTKFISALIQVAIYTISAFLLSWVVCLAILSVGVVITGTLWTCVRLSRKAGAEQTKSAKNLMRSISEIMHSVKPMRSMRLEDNYLKYLYNDSKKLRISHYQQMLSSQSLRIFHEPLLVISAIIGIYIALHVGNLQGSALIVILVFFSRIMTGLNSAQSEYQRLAKEESALWSFLDVLHDIAKHIEDHKGTNACPNKIKTISFRHVYFNHKSTKVLKDLDISFSANSFTVLMGASGSGKTTILDLLNRFHKPDSGDILINDTNIDLIDIDSWRGKIGFMPQDVYLFNTSIKENILMGRETLTHDDIWKALKKAGAYDFVKNLDGELDYNVGENGGQLSGGQKQRIAIARAIIHNPEILILDEATSALDSHTEKALFETFKDLSKSMIVIMSSHNEAVSSYADTTIYLGTT